MNIVNVIYSCKEKSDDYRKLALNGMIVKLFHIPYYLFTFMISLFLLISAVVPALLLLTPIMAIIIGIINYFLMITSSLYGINALIRLKAKEKITNTFFIVHFVMHFILVLDVISIIFVYIKTRKVEKGCIE